MKPEEQVLVVERKALEALLPNESFITQGLDAIARFIQANHTYHPRAEAEYDSTVKQIIPYVILRQQGRYFLLRRLKKQTETRLHDKLSLGLGGHINPTEEAEADVVQAGLLRELSEEVNVAHIASLTRIGFLNENNGGVSDYHAALVFLLEAEGTVTVRETEKMTGTWVTPQALVPLLPQLETWSKIIAEQVILTDLV